MRHLVLPALLWSALLAGCSSGGGGTLNPQREAELVAQSRHLAMAFQTELQEALKSALAATGPTGAIDVCASVAPAIASQLSEDNGAIVRRTALKVRNPDARPDAFERETMRAWLGAPATPDGTPAERHLLVRGSDGSTEFRFMRAIPMGEPCSICHGGAIAPDVERAIAERYPDDRATHFAPGELRGAFSIRWPLVQK